MYPINEVDCERASSNLNKVKGAMELGYYKDSDKQCKGARSTCKHKRRRSD
jgi:hypothetical protein